MPRVAPRLAVLVWSSPPAAYQEWSSEGKEEDGKERGTTKRKKEKKKKQQNPDKTLENRGEKIGKKEKREG